MKNAAIILRKKSWLMTLLLFMNVSVFAQSKTVTGKVTDSSNAPLANVSVQVKGSGSGTVTDSSGSFSLSVPANVNQLVVRGNWTPPINVHAVLARSQRRRVGG